MFYDDGLRDAPRITDTLNLLFFLQLLFTLLPFCFLSFLSEDRKFYAADAASALYSPSVFPSLHSLQTTILVGQAATKQLFVCARHSAVSAGSRHALCCAHLGNLRCAQPHRPASRAAPSSPPPADDGRLAD